MRKYNGFGLIEVLIALALISVGYLSYSRLMISSTQKTVLANQEFVATQSADYIINKVKQNLIYADSGNIHMSALHYVENSYDDDLNYNSQTGIPTANYNVTDSISLAKFDLYTWKQEFNKNAKLDSIKSIVCEDAIPYGLPNYDSPNCKSTGTDVVVKIIWRSSSNSLGNNVYSNLVRAIPIVADNVYKNSGNMSKCDVIWESKLNGCDKYEDCSGKLIIGDCSDKSICHNSYILGSCYGDCAGSFVLKQCSGSCNRNLLAESLLLHACLPNNSFDKATCSGNDCRHSLVGGGCANGLKCDNNIVFGECSLSSCNDSIIFGDCIGSSCNNSIVFGSCSASKCSDSLIIGNSTNSSSDNSTIRGTCNNSSCNGAKFAKCIGESSVCVAGMGVDNNLLNDSLLVYFDSYLAAFVNVSIPDVNDLAGDINCSGNCQNKTIYGNCTYNCSGSIIYGDCSGWCNNATIYGKCSGDSCSNSVLLYQCASNNCSNVKRPINLDNWNNMIYQNIISEYNDSKIVIK